MPPAPSRLLRSLIKYGLVALCGAVAGVSVYRIVRRSGKRTKQVRVWMDGCFDLMHFGHANAFRQGAAIGDYLIVGVNPDEEIIKYKGKPIMNNEERLIAVKACRWVDEVVEGVPYVMDPEYLDYVIEKYDLDFVCHGDDLCLTNDGEDVYATAKALGKYREIKRTEGVSTTDIVGRMLSAEASTEHHVLDIVGEEEEIGTDMSIRRRYSELSEAPEEGSRHRFARVTSFLPTTMRFRQFASGRSPAKGDTVVFVPGVWDLFHAGHIKLLEAAAKLGDFLLVGVHRDDTANRYRKGNYPIMNLHERALGVLSCRYVDEIILGCPWEVTKDLMITFNISLVVCGNVGDFPRGDDQKDIYKVPTEMGIMRFIESTNDLTTTKIVRRVQESRDQFEQKFEKKSKKEAEYLENKTYVEEL